MTEFKSQLETILPCKELLFDGTPGFGRYAPFLGHAIAHPAKMNTRLTEYLILQLTKPGDLVLDPMSGSGQTGIIASLNSRDSVCVELEERFHSWQLKAKSEIETAQTFTKKGQLNCILGDARKLGGLLVDAVVTSPPYSDSKKGTLDAEDWANRMEKFGSTPDSRRERHTPGRLTGAQSMGNGYSTNPENIGNLPLGEIDAVITSPPYEDSVSDDKEGPLAGANEERYGRWKEGTAKKNSYTQHEEPCKVDAVITSPPYDEGTGHGRGKDTKLQDEKKLYLHGAGSYSNSKDNIGEMKKETYLQAMLTVYGEIFSVLKPSGLAAVVVKPFIRNKQVVDLPYQTWLLMQKCGFELTGSYKLRLDMQSFWRVLYMKKHPEVPEIWHEYVLVCQKPVSVVLACNSSTEVKQ